MRIDYIHEFIHDLLRKEQKGYHSPEQIDKAINRGQYRVFNTYMPLYAVNSEAKEALAPFIVKLPFGTDADGKFSIPTSEAFQGLAGMGITYNEGGVIRSSVVAFPPEDELESRLNSQLLKPTTSKPVGEVLGLGSYQLHPAAVYAGTVRFFRKPQEAKYAYTQAGRSISYDDAGSKQLEWAEKYQDKVILAALSLLGINLGDDAVVQVSEALSKLK